MRRADGEQARVTRRWMHRLALVVVALAASWLPACETKTDDSLLVMVDPDAAIKAMNDRSGVLGIGKTKSAWVDPRSLEAYRKGHIPGAIHLPFSNVADDHEHLLVGVNSIVVYGDDYNDIKAKAMSKRLIELGYKDVRTLNGGLRQWTAQGHKTETGDPKTAADSTSTASSG